MDESVNGVVVGFSSVNSKFEIVCLVVRSLVDIYFGKINMGFMVYQQNMLLFYYLYNVFYDISYNLGNYDVSFSGVCNLLIKVFQVFNLFDLGNFFYYNVVLLFYVLINQGNVFCYGFMVIVFNNGENFGSGFWDSYCCFFIKMGSNDGVVFLLFGGGIKVVEIVFGYSGLIGIYIFFLIDSDLV